MKKVILLAAVCLSFLTQVVFAADYVTYTTARGSVLELSASDENNAVTGFFTITMDVKTCPAMKGVRKPMTGTSVDNLVNFTVSYPECHEDITLGGKLLADNFLKITSIKIHETSFAQDMQDEDNLIGV